MSMNDPIADMLARIRDTRAMEKASVVMPSSKPKVAITKVLKDEDYIDEFAATEQGGKSMLMTGLKYYAGRPVMGRLGHVSKPGLRVYKGRDEIPQVMNSLGVAVVSTPQGLMTDRRARATGIDGEIICYAA